MNIEWSSEKDKFTVEGLAKNNKVTARRMERIRAASDFTDLQHPANGRAKFLKYDYKGCFSIDLESKTRPKRLICKPIGNFKKDEKGFYIKETITEFKIIKIEKNYHKK